MNLLLRPWRHYADFRGRSRRLEYAIFAVIFYGVLLLIPFIAGARGPAPSSPGLLKLAVGLGLFALAAVIPGVAVSVRRLRDLGISGWWMLIWLVPTIGQPLGFLLTVIIMFVPAPHGENRYGRDPRDAEGANETAALSEVFS